MKKIYVFLIVSALAALTLPLMAADCGSNGVTTPCTTDADCTDGATCQKAAPDTGACADGDVGCTCEGGSGEGEGGEGEGEGGDCAGDDGALGTGSGLVVDSASLDANGTAGSDCTAEGGSPFDLTVSLPAAGQPASWDGTVPNATWITFQSGDNEAAYNESFCNGGAVACADGTGADCDGSADCFCVCGLCLGATPNDLAVQVTDTAGDTSDGVCVDLSGA